MKFIHTDKFPMHTHLFPPGRQARVSSDASLNVEVTFTVATQVDRAWCDVDVHQVVDDSALDVVKDAVHQVATAHIHDLYVRQVPDARWTRTICQLCQFNLLQAILCILTCPELHPEAGRMTHNTRFSSWSPQWPAPCCSVCSQGCPTLLAKKRGNNESLILLFRYFSCRNILDKKRENLQLCFVQWRLGPHTQTPQRTPRLMNRIENDHRV